MKSESVEVSTSTLEMLISVLTTSKSKFKPETSTSSQFVNMNHSDISKSTTNNKTISNISVLLTEALTTPNTTWSVFNISENKQLSLQETKNNVAHITKPLDEQITASNDLYKYTGLKNNSGIKSSTTNYYESAYATSDLNNTIDKMNKTNTPDSKFENTSGIVYRAKWVFYNYQHVCYTAYG